MQVLHLCTASWPAVKQVKRWGSVWARVLWQNRNWAAMWTICSLLPEELKHSSLANGYLAWKTEWTHPLKQHAAFTLWSQCFTRDPCKNYCLQYAWSRGADKLTEVVGHQGRRWDGRLGELFSPAALLLQVLQNVDKWSETQLTLQTFIVIWVEQLKAPKVSHLCSYF